MDRSRLCCHDAGMVTYSIKCSGSLAGMGYIVKFIAFNSSLSGACPVDVAISMSSRHADLSKVDPCTGQAAYRPGWAENFVKTGQA